MKTLISTLLVAAISLASVQASHAISDQSVAASYGCTTALGNTVGAGPGLRASGGTAVVLCSVDQEIGKSLINVWARVKPALANGARPFCNIHSYNAYNSLNDISYKWASNNANNQSLSIPIPDGWSGGYTLVSCTLNVNDIFYGFRYRQD